MPGRSLSPGEAATADAVKSSRPPALGIRGRAGRPNEEQTMPAPNRVPVERVRQLLAQGVMAKAICERLGINKTSVSRISAGMKREQVKT